MCGVQVRSQAVCRLWKACLGPSNPVWPIERFTLVPTTDNPVYACRLYSPTVPVGWVTQTRPAVRKLTLELRKGTAFDETAAQDLYMALLSVQPEVRRPCMLH
jgi:hypothetical protein